MKKHRDTFHAKNTKHQIKAAKLPRSGMDRWIVNGASTALPQPRMSLKASLIVRRSYLRCGLQLALPETTISVVGNIKTLTERYLNDDGKRVKKTTRYKLVQRPCRIKKSVLEHVMLSHSLTIPLPLGDLRFFMVESDYP